MKILFYNHTGKVSGAERVLLMILAKLDRERFHPVVMCPSDGPLMEMISHAGVQVISISPLAARFTLQPARLVQYLTSFVRMMREGRRVVVAEAPAVIHANSIRAGLVMTAATIGLGIPVVWHAHDLLPGHPLSTAIRLFAFAFRRTHIIAVSVAVAERFRGSLWQFFLRRPSITVVHNAVDVEVFQPNSIKRGKTRELLGFSEQQQVIGTIGQLTPRKGQLELIEAFAEVARDFPAAKLLIVGEALFNRDFEYADALRKTARELGIADRVIFLGQREDMPDITRALDIAVVNSRAEPFGLTVVEAMASGTPVLATAVDGIQEIVSHGLTGWLVISGDRYGLVEGMRTLLADADMRARISLSALTAVRLRFTTGRFLNAIQDLYRSIPAIRAVSHPGRARSFKVKLSTD